jgi:hypothetical protein
MILFKNLLNYVYLKILISIKMDIKERYLRAKNTHSDINEHIETFYKYAKKYRHITEFGVRSVVSSWGFLYGLYESQYDKKKLIGVDLEWHDNINSLKNLAQSNGIEYEFIQDDSIKVDIEDTDILFIDTWHIYGHLKRELEKHHSKVKEYIMMHDTTVDEIYGETVRCVWNAEEQSKTSGYPIEEIKKGLGPAIDEFLIQHPEWKLHEKYKNNNGLTILKRIYT